MSLTDKINNDIKEAMKAKDRDRLSTLRSIKSALMLEMTKGGDSELTDEVGMAIMTKLYKQRNESASVYKEQGRDDLAQAEEVEAAILAEYLPAQMSEDEIEAKVKEIIAQTGASSMKDMGKVMGMASGAMAGTADGKVIAAIVKKMLA